LKAAGAAQGAQTEPRQRDGAVMHHKRAHRKCEAARAASARKRACAPSAGNREPCAFAGDTAVLLGWAHNLMFRYTGVGGLELL
jgi:hypothetical protein